MQIKQLVVASALLAMAGSAFAYRGQIDGDFEGWQGNSTYELEDGHVIKQASYEYDYCYAYNPDVVIYQNYGTYHAIVKCGDNKDVEIEVLK
jgi:hypothetical protein